MKKILTLFLILCLLASVATCFAFSANAEEKEIQVSVGQSFEWNDQSPAVTGDPKSKLNWHKSGGVSPDGLWSYQFYALARKMYFNMHACGNDFAWNASSNTKNESGLDWARVLNLGKSFHPDVAADVVKVFKCPSGGTIQISSIVARTTDLKSGSSATGTSFAIYVEDRLVYPEEGDGEYLTLVSTDEQTIDVTVDVAKGERVRIHIGAIGDNSNDGVNMSNVITYKTVNNNAAEGVTEDTLVFSTISRTEDTPDLPDTNDSNTGGGSKLPVKNDGLSTGAIIGIVAGVVAVVGIAVVVVIVLKKKKQD